MTFFDAAANWADRQGVNVTFWRDDNCVWFAVLTFGDTRGAFTTKARSMRQLPKRTESGVKLQAELDADYQRRVDVVMNKAAVKGRRDRMVDSTGRPVAAAHAY